jgi:hypothetical protein
MPTAPLRGNAVQPAPDPARARRLGNEPFFSAPQLERGPLGRHRHGSARCLDAHV